MFIIYTHIPYIYIQGMCILYNYVIILSVISTHISYSCAWIFHVCPGYFGDSVTTTKHPFLMSECFALWLLSALLCGF